MEAKIKGVIVSKNKGKIIIKDNNNGNWIIQNPQPVYDGVFGLSKTLGRKIFIGKGLVSDIHNIAVPKEKNVYIVIDISSCNPQNDEDYQGLESEIYFE